MSSPSLTTRFLADAGGPVRDGRRMRTAPFWPQNRPRRAGFRAAITAAYRRHRSRMALASLDASLLKDIGVSFAEAEHEANKPFWRS